MIGPETPLFVLLAGVALLVAGRRLFWLFVGLVGFFTVYQWSEPYSGTLSSGRWILAVAAGLLGILLAIFLQRFAVALAGFFVGGWAVVQFLGLNVASLRTVDLVICLVAGVLAAILAVKVFEIALVFLSSLAGASLIVDAFHPGPGVARVLLVGLLVVGIAVQFGFTARRRAGQSG
jgi:hypothetical protein